MKITQISILLFIVCLSAANVCAQDDNGDPGGLPECEAIAGMNRYIVIGDSADKVIKYLESNRYRCETLKSIEKQIVNCSISNDAEIDVQLTVEFSVVVDIDTNTFPHVPDCNFINNFNNANDVDF